MHLPLKRTHPLPGADRTLGRRHRGGLAGAGQVPPNTTKPHAGGAAATLDLR